MPRPIWKGDVSFGLVNIPVTLFSLEKRNDIHFKLLDSRDCAHIRYEKVNEDTGEEVPWGEIVKGYEYDDGSFVVMNKEDFERASIEKTHTIDIEDFVDREEIELTYFDKPYVVVPTKRGQKAYVLFRDTLEKSGKVGIAKVVIRTRQYLAAVMPQEKALVINVLRFKQELKSLSEFDLPDEASSSYKISAKEKKLSEQLVESMVTDWDPEGYHDDYRETLMKYIEEKAKKGTVEIDEPEEEEEESNVIDIMSLLRKSIGEGDDSKKSKSSKKKSSKKKTKSTSKKKSSKKASKSKASKKSSSSGSKRKSS